MPYSYLDDITIADAAFEARGHDLPSLFAAAAEATMKLMVDPLEAIENKRELQLSLTENEVDILLFQFLQELIYYKDAEDLLLRVSDIDISMTDDFYQLTARAWGEYRDPGRHRLKVDVKAVTLHRFGVEQTEDGWKATVVLDI